MAEIPAIPVKGVTIREPSFPPKGILPDDALSMNGKYLEHALEIPRTYDGFQVDQQSQKHHSLSLPSLQEGEGGSSRATNEEALHSTTGRKFRRPYDANYNGRYNPEEDDFLHLSWWTLSQGSHFSNVDICNKFLSHGIPPAKRVH